MKNRFVLVPVLLFFSNTCHVTLEQQLLTVVASISTQLRIYWTTSSLIHRESQTKMFFFLFQSLPCQVAWFHFFDSSCSVLNWPNAESRMLKQVQQWPFGKRTMGSLISNSKFPLHLYHPVSQISPSTCVSQQNLTQAGGGLRLTALILLAYWSLVWSCGELYLRESVLQTAAVCSCVLAPESCVFRGLNCWRSRWRRPPSVVSAPELPQESSSLKRGYASSS